MRGERMLYYGKKLVIFMISVGLLLSLIHI